MCCRVSTGSKISILNDAWIMGASNYRLSYLVISDDLLTVDQLTDNNSRMWNKELVNYTFHPNDVERSCESPCQQFCTKMRWFGVMRHRGPSQ